MITNSPITPDHILQAGQNFRFGTIIQLGWYGEPLAELQNEEYAPGA